MKTNEIDHLLKQAASRAAESDYFFAKVLRAYEKFEGLTHLELAQHLRCTNETLIRLALCRRPDSGDPARFKADVEQVAAHFGIDAAQLANLVRYVDTMESLSQSPQLTGVPTDTGILLTARDQEHPNETEEKKDMATNGNNEEGVEEDKENDTP